MKPMQLALVALFSALLTACGGGDDDAPARHSYAYSVVGDPQRAVQVQPAVEPSVAILGGGPDVDRAFRWMIERSGVRPGTGGRFVIIRASVDDDDNAYVYYSNAQRGTTGAAANAWVGGAAMGLSSVETLVIPDREAADDPLVNEVVGRAQAVFIGGGDQANYINYWKNSRLHATLNRLMQANVPIGGTSAGLAVLGQFDFAALRDGIGTAEALANPYSGLVTLDPDPLRLTGGFLVPGAFRNTILDSHFGARNRMGRLMSFVSRLVAPYGGGGCEGGILTAGTSPQNGARGIGVDEQTALLVQGDGVRTPFTGQRVTNPGNNNDSAVYFVRPLQPATHCSPLLPLSAPNFEVRKLADDSVFNLSDWSGQPIPAYTVDIRAGVLSRNPY